MTHLSRDTFPLPTFPLSSLASDTPSSNGSGASPYSNTPSSSTYSGELPASLVNHPPPSMPSTFLPSYYPESRYSDTFPSRRLSEDGIRMQVSSEREKRGITDPSHRHLLDGVASPPRPPRASAMPTYHLSPGPFSRELLPIPSSWSSRSREHAYESSVFDRKAGEGGGSSSRSIRPGSPPASSPHPSSQPLSRPPGSTPSPSMAPPASPRRQPSQSGQPPSLQSTKRGSYSGTTLPEPVPQSSAYPGMLFGSVPLLGDSLMGAPSFSSTGPESRVSGEDYAQALNVYEHILSAIPHIRPHPSFSPDPLTPSSSRSQPFDTLVQLAADGLQFLSGRTSRSDSALSEDGRPVSPRPVQTKRASGTMHGEKAKVMTKCLGCGATATPEWRRGPMGPRTLCNACGLVHMKLQRKRRKLEEKAAAAAKAKADGG